MRIKTAIAVSTIGLLWFAFSVATAKTICVNPAGTGGCYSTIQGAINVAIADDTVIVQPGTYNESISISNRIVLIGFGHDVTAVEYTGGLSKPAVTFAGSSSGGKIIGFRITSSSGSGVRVESNISPIVSNCFICWSNNYGINIMDVSYATPIITNCVVSENGWQGIAVRGNSTEPKIYNTILYKNSYQGIWRSWYSAISQYCCFFNNSLGDLSGLPSGIGDLLATDPSFVNYPTDLHLLPGSPLVNKGRPGTTYYDCNGTQNDIGIYGGPDAICGPGPVVTSLQLVHATVVKGEKFEIQATGATR